MASNGALIYEEEEIISKGIRIEPISSTPISAQWEVDASKKQAVPLALRDRLGFDDFFSLNVIIVLAWRASVGEILGTAILVFAIDTIAISSIQTETKTPNAWRASVGEILGTAILVFAIDTIVISSIQTETKTPNVLLSILVAIIITILLLAIHPVSGGHINPIVSFSAGLVGLISMSRAAIYIVAQCIGAVLGALALKAVVSSSIENAYSLGGCTLAVITPGSNGPIVIGLKMEQAFWLEIICSFVFLVASIWMAYDKRQKKELGQTVVFSIVGTVLGLLVFISTTVTAQKGYAGSVMNPDRCLGPALVRGGHLWNGHWIFWVGPAISCVAFYIYTKFIPGEHFQPADLQRHDFFNVLKPLAS